jgi:type I restriction enzyme M protein
MNKQQLAAKIWESANNMRSKIEANEYKDYILGFIFYMFLSNKEEEFIKNLGETDLTKITPENTDYYNYIKQNLGYFISYQNLFSSWFDHDFSVDKVNVALQDFERNIDKSYEQVFRGVFATLQTGLSKLGDTAAAQTKAIKDLINLIREIPTDGRQDYDVLGFIYEYLIKNFAANAGKKAGEFYTPHEVSLLMSEIVASHLKDREKIRIYDPTSGSGSLLINIGKCVAKHRQDKNSISYFAQELKGPTYNLTRMNLVMRGIIPANIHTRNADTLETDWPPSEDNPAYPLRVDAVVSNPPYSQKWNPTDKAQDPRYSYGLAPESKADYAFLLHDLYHVKPDGIMTIVMPHGVLFRGGEEGTIRMNLVEKNNIFAIIGLPPNVFFGTGIPTIIIVLKPQKNNTDILIIDASKGFEKQDAKNVLRARDIKKIIDIINSPAEVKGFSALATLEQIRDNGYNLNIPRYVDSSDKPESWDIHSIMSGGIPQQDIDLLDNYWQAFPSLKEALFVWEENGKILFKDSDTIKDIVHNHENVKDFIHNFNDKLKGFDQYLKEELIEKLEKVNVSTKEEEITAELFRKIEKIPLCDKYEAYQILSSEWKKTELDFETMQEDKSGPLQAVRTVVPNMVLNNKKEEVQKGWKGAIIPFELAQQELLPQLLEKIHKMESRIAEIEADSEQLISALTEEQKDTEILNNDNTAFNKTGINNEAKNILQDIETEEIKLLRQYLGFGGKKEKLKFMQDNADIFKGIETNKDGTCSKANIKKLIEQLKQSYAETNFQENSYEWIIFKAKKLLDEKAGIKLTDRQKDIHDQTKTAIENMTDEQAKTLLFKKWIEPVVKKIMAMPNGIIEELVSRLQALNNKYATTMFYTENQIKDTEKSLAELVGSLSGDDLENKGLAELKKMLGGE